MNNEIGLIGLVREYPEFKYSTKELIDILGNKLSEKVKENIIQLGVENRHFIRSIDTYIENSKNRINSDNYGEPISDLSAEVGKQCLNNLGLKPENITCLVSAYENNDFQSPGLASLLVTKIGLSKFIPHYSIQGMACSTLPKLLELGKNLVRDEKDNVLVVISGCNSGWYLPHLKDDMDVKNPKEINPNQHDREKQIRKWVSTMFSFLFGDGVAAFVLTKTKGDQPTIKIGKISHAVNFNETDYRKACVRMLGQHGSHLYEYELTAASDILARSLDYSKKVLMKLLEKDVGTFDENIAETYMTEQKKVMIHTGSLKILDGFKNFYKLRNEQIEESYNTLKNYGNLTGVSIPTVMDKALFQNGNVLGKGLLIGITMGFGLDMVEVERI